MRCQQIYSMLFESEHPLSGHPSLLRGPVKIYLLYYTFVFVYTVIKCEIFD